MYSENAFHIFQFIVKIKTMVYKYLNIQTELINIIISMNYNTLQWHEKLFSIIKSIFEK